MTTKTYVDFTTPAVDADWLNDVDRLLYDILDNPADDAAVLTGLGITATVAELNALDGITSTVAELNILDGVTSTAAELNILDGATLTVTELNYVDGVTSAIQTQLDAKAALVGTTASVGDNDTSIATTAFVQASRLPNFRNKIINGAMTIDQRNGGVAQTITAAAALAYTVDRWYAYCTGANATGQQVAGAATNQYRYRFTGAASVTAIGFAQRIEAENCYDLNNATATLSVDLANSLLTTVTWTAYYANTADAFGTLASPTRTQIATGTFTVTSTVTNYTAQITIPSAAITGIEIVFTVGAQISGTWHIGNVQLEGGNIATPFERRLNSVEMVLCQRYYQTIGGITNGFGVQGYASGAAQGVSHTISFQTTMRATPLTGVMPTMANINTAGAVINNMSTNCFLLIAAATGAGSVSSLNTTGGSATFTSEIP